jgi:hypothetical protein
MARFVIPGCASSGRAFARTRCGCRGMTGADSPAVRANRSDFPDFASPKQARIRQNRVRQKIKFAWPFKPVEARQPLALKDFSLRKSEIVYCYARPVPSKRGASRSSRVLGAGRDGRCDVN